MCCFCGVKARRLPKHAAERDCQSAGSVSPEPAPTVVVNINFIRASIIANYFHWRERAHQTRYFILREWGVENLALSAKRVSHD